MNCPLCSARKARRACPALGHQICAVCCGTKRLITINCPGDCVYLTAARDHPAAVVLRQQQRDLMTFAHTVRDLNHRQSQLLIGVASFIAHHRQPIDLQPLIDADVREAAGALAATFETASRGVIFEHRPQSLPAARLAAALQQLLREAADGAGTPFERDAAVVLRRVEEAVGLATAAEPANRRAYLDGLGRIAAALPRRESADTGTATPSGERLILP